MHKIKLLKSSVPTRISLFYVVTFVIAFTIVKKCSRNLQIQDTQQIPNTYVPGDLEKSTWNLAYSKESMRKKVKDPCRGGWPGPECPKVPEGGITAKEKGSITKALKAAVASERKCRFSFQSCASGYIRPHGLGKCAIVGLSDTLGFHGDLIDSHDAVFRIGFLPLERYKVRSGIKTNFTLCRGFQKSVLSCLSALPIDVYGRSPTSRLYPSGDYGKVIVLKTLEEIQNLRPNIKINENVNTITSTETKLRFSKLSNGFRKSSGFTYVYYILSSGICSSISLFGYSRERSHAHFFSDIEGGFLQVAPLDAIHSPKFESEALEILGVRIY